MVPGLGGDGRRALPRVKGAQVKIEQDPNSNPTPESIEAWQRQSHAADLEREVEGRRRRVLELEAMSAHPSVIAQTKAEQHAAEDALRQYGERQPTAPKRPRTPSDRQTRKKGES